MAGLMTALLMAAAAAGAGPTPLDPQAVRHLGDLADNSLPSVRDGVAFADVAVDFMGVPIRCDIARSSGMRGLDARTCAALMRLRFRPARDEAGVPIASVYAASIRWATYGFGPAGYMPDETVQVAKLPEGARQPVVAVRQIIGADGALESCEIERGSGVAGLDRLACKQADALVTFGPVKDRAGKPVRTLRIARILFVEKPG